VQREATFNEWVGKMKSTILSEISKPLAIASELRQRTENSLVRAARTGESTAFAELCQRNFQQLMRAALRVTRNREDAEDAVQDALLNAFLHIGDFDGRSSFATWVTRIAINAALMILRKRRTALEQATESLSDSNGELWAHKVPDRAPSPEASHAQNEEWKILENAIETLRPSLRKVVKIQQLAECSMGETAKTLDISVAAAKSRLFHAKAQLRRSSAMKILRRTRVGYRTRVLTAA
jgi:RNA polymerase sigma factor (sigma-70 family)